MESTKQNTYISEPIKFEVTTEISNEIIDKITDKIMNKIMNKYDNYEKEVDNSIKEIEKTPITEKQIIEKECDNTIKEFKRTPITEEQIMKSKNKIHIKFYKPFVDSIINLNGINLNGYVPHQGYLTAFQKQRLGNEKKSNIYRFYGTTSQNMIMVEQQEMIGFDETGQPRFGEEKHFIKHEYFKPFIMSDQNSINQFKRMFPEYIPDVKKYVRLEYAGQIYILEPFTEFKVNPETNYIETRKFKDINGNIEYIDQEFTINNKCKFGI